MHSERIRKLARTASDLDLTNNYEAAFALRWIAYEGLLRRAAIKALWMRGASVKEAEKALMRIQRDPTSLLADCCNTFIDTDRKTIHPIIKIVKDRADIRNLLFHQLSVGSKKQLLLLSDILKRVLEDPKTALKSVPVSIPGVGSSEPLGNPLDDLRKMKRKPHVKAKAISGLISYSKDEVRELPELPDLSEEEYLHLFLPMTSAKAPFFGLATKPKLTNEEVRKRLGITQDKKSQ